MPKRQKDQSQVAAVLVAKVTKQGLPKGGELLGDPELQARYNEAMRQELERKAAKLKRLG